MVTQEQKLQHVKEAAGECWHTFKKVGYGGSCLNNCGIHDSRTPNPSPDDLNELFRLAKKVMSIHSLVFDYFNGLSGVHLVGNINIHCVDVQADGNTEAEALLNALFIATGGKE